MPMITWASETEARSGSKVSTKEAMRLFSSAVSRPIASPPVPSPVSLPVGGWPAKYKDIDFHGIMYPLIKDLSTNGAEEVRVGQASSTTLQKPHSRMNTSIYPPKNRIPDVNSPQVQAWVAEIDWSKVPNIPVAEGLPDVPHFPKCPPDDQLDRSACWWSCAGCVAPEDVVTCPDKNSWGLTYDDGPRLATKDMMKYLENSKLTATFFIVRSRILEYTDILKEQITHGHHIAMHSDTDKRGQVQEWEILQSFDTHLSARDNIKSSVGLPGGPVTLGHDLNNATISVSKRLIPMAMGKGLNPMSLAHCWSDTTPYQHGSRLRSNGALEKITNGEGKGSYRGMPGMEE
ncbi:chitin deacetylase [Mortierella sp. NVP85]|nr:chitin deacetylase [Mortierella sp. NVP85]